MTTARPAGYPASLVRDVRKLPQETEWLELLDRYLMKGPDQQGTLSASCSYASTSQAVRT
jgi:hypothetical protein